MTVAIVFAGQGAHRDGMASAWRNHRSYATFAEVGRVCGLPDLARLADDPSACAATAVAQPAVFAAGLATWRALIDVGVEPSALAGHSLGEVTAAVAAGSLSVRDGAALVAERGRAFSAACTRNPGTMTAVLGLDPPVVEEALVSVEGVTVANDNAPGQTVIAGPPQAVDDAAAACRAAGGRVRALDVEGAFHTTAMAPAIVRVAAILRRLDVTDPKAPLVTGATADVARTAVEVRRGIVDGVLAPVRWREVQSRLVELGADVIVEAGPGVLRALARRTVPEVTAVSADSPETVRQVAAKLMLGGRPPARTAPEVAGRSAEDDATARLIEVQAR
ncbi:MAG: ACP S-malonyltransferase [Actinomycetota bacterium]|nr:ACP S-malonyltransferase [Actinomycetota bacterium]